MLRGGMTVDGVQKHSKKIDFTEGLCSFFFGLVFSCRSLPLLTEQKLNHKNILDHLSFGKNNFLFLSGTTNKRRNNNNSNFLTHKIQSKSKLR